MYESTCHTTNRHLMYAKHFVKCTLITLLTQVNKMTKMAGILKNNDMKKKILNKKFQNFH